MTSVPFLFFVAFPRVSRVFPRVSMVFPRVSKVFPRVSRVFPRDSRVFPGVSRVFSGCFSHRVSIGFFLWLLGFFLLGFWGFSFRVSVDGVIFNYI